MLPYYKDVFHGSQSVIRPDIWRLFDRAADVSYPNLPTYPGCEFTRPDAEASLTVREFDRWYKSIGEVLFQVLWSIPAQFAMELIVLRLGAARGEPRALQPVGSCGLAQARCEQEVRKSERASDV